jgi:signal transduction histidine kinase
MAGSSAKLRVDLAGAAVLDGRLSPEAAHELVQIAREALSNVARHSGASRATLTLRVDGEDAELAVEDDGTGFDPGQRFGSGHFGLANLRDRASALAGSLSIETAPGRGVRIIVRLPLAPEVAA